MKKSELLPAPPGDDPRIAKAKEVGRRLMNKEGDWHDLSTDDLCDLLIPPGVRGVPGDDESAALLETLHENVGKWRGSCWWEVEIVGGIHMLRYVVGEREAMRRAQA